jgi:hypothetical protein
LTIWTTSRQSHIPTSCNVHFALSIFFFDTDTSRRLPIFGAPSLFDIFIRDAAQDRLLRALFGNMSGTAFIRMRKNRDLVYRTARELIQSKLADLLKGEESKDVISTLGTDFIGSLCWRTSDFGSYI